MSNELDLVNDEIKEIKAALEEDRVSVKLLAQEVKALTLAVRENNRLLQGSNGNSVLVRLALLEANSVELEKKVTESNSNNSSSNQARIQLVGTAITAGLALLGTIVLGAFSMFGG